MFARSPIIELEGLPGGGKSTFARRLETEGLGKIVTIHGRFELLAYALLETLLHPIRSTRILFVITRNLGNKELRYEKFVNLFLVHQAKYGKSGRYTRPIIDQGHMQSLVSLFDRALSENEIINYAKLFSRADIVIVFDIEKRLRNERMQERGYSTREKYSKELREEWQAASEENQKQFVNSLRLLPFGGELVSNDTDADQLLARLKRKDKLCYVLDTRIPTERAYGNQIAAMSEALSQVGVEVEILAPFRRVGMDEDIYEYYHVERNFRLRYFSSFDFFQFSRLFGKLSYYFNIASVLFSLLCVPIDSGVTVFTRKPEIAWLMKKRGYRVIYECHDWFLHARRVQLRMLKYVEHIVVTNSYIAKEFLAHGFTHERVHILQNAVSLDIFQIEVAKEDARERLGLSLQIPNHSNKKIVLYTGSFKAMGEQKGVDEIIRAMEGLDDDVVFIAVGGSQEDIEHYGQMAKHHQVSERVFLLPRCGKENLALFQQAADVLMVLFPKRVHFVYYLSPLKTFEYMASGRPIIASDLPSIREILDDTSAYFVTPGDTAELQWTITHVLTHAEEAKEKAEHARVKSEQFTWKNRAGKIASLLN